MKKQLQLNEFVRLLMRGSLLQIVLLTSFMSISYANGSIAQILEKKVSLHVENTTLRSVLSKIEKETDAQFLFHTNMITGERVTLHVDNESLEQVLNKLLQPVGIIYEAEGNKIILSKIFSIGTDSEAMGPSASQPTAMVVNGTITDEENKSLPGVNILEKGTTNGTISDANGEYKISVTDANATLVFSFIGYASQEVAVNDRTVVNVSLAVDVLSLGEVVVTALGIKRDKKSLGYSVSEISGTELAQAKEVNLANSLSGKIAGVQVSRAATGAGGASKVIIRGNNSLSGNSQPLYVVDGIPIDNQNAGGNRTGGIDFGDGISNINPADIESMSVLKGPNAAALYGQRGSNGVIIITTKSGKSGKGIGIKFSSDYSVGEALVLPDFQDEYGQGLDGNFTHWRGIDDKIYSWAQVQQNGIQGMPKMSGGRDRFARSSWGPRMEGQQYEDQWGNILQCRFLNGII
ncbi:MAG: TonB-dependent receptor plug domain-containing protein [Cyclobacteriaceae bacterium]|nr:TonB-dependent receptor plug domain-containing protein [Cyclobacteriaceae bacterium]